MHRQPKRLWLWGLGVCLLSAFMLTSQVVQAQEIFIDFEDGNLDDWEVVDEAAANLGDPGPSTWEIRNSQGLDGKALYQGSNIWGSAADTCLMGTFIIYKAQKFIDFIMDVDVFPTDNDGMGVVWAYEATNRHYRAIMINDSWPDVPVDGVKGPFMKIAKRISDDEPWYELLEAITPPKYVNYPENQRMHWTLEVSGGKFTFTRDDGVSISAEDHDYTEGYVGFQLYAQQAEFDNVKIVDTYPVDPRGKLASMWGTIKSQ